MHSERRGRPCVVLGGFSLEDRIEPGTWAAGTSPLWLLYSLQTEYFVCTHIVFFSLSLSPPGWPKTHQVDEDDFELPNPPASTSSAGMWVYAALSGFTGCWGIKPRAWRMSGTHSQQLRQRPSLCVCIGTVLRADSSRAAQAPPLGVPPNRL